LELSDYFNKLIFNQQTAAPEKVPPWAWSTQGPSLAMPLVLHFVHQLTLREFFLNNMRFAAKAECWSTM